MTLLQELEQYFIVEMGNMQNAFYNGLSKIVITSSYLFTSARNRGRALAKNFFKEIVWGDQIINLTDIFRA